MTSKNDDVVGIRQIGLNEPKMSKWKVWRKSFLLIAGFAIKI